MLNQFHYHEKGTTSCCNHVYRYCRLYSLNGKDVELELYLIISKNQKLELIHLLDNAIVGMIDFFLLGIDPIILLRPNHYFKLLLKYGCYTDLLSLTNWQYLVAQNTVIISRR